MNDTARPAHGSRTVLVVEDDEAMGVALQDGFASEGDRVLRARDGASGLRLATDHAVDIVILDVMLPRMSGLDVCRRLRHDRNNVPIIMLTARGQEIDRVVGLRAGADDYVTKPFSFLELLARVEAVLRRASGARNGDGGPERYVLGSVTLDFKRLEAQRDGRAVDLTPREFGLLRFFICHEGEVLSRDKLLDAVWGYSSSPLTRTVDTHIAKLRKKIEENPNDPRHIVTVHRVGYKFVG
jgi:two-component system alkaline phosphatase synthesis response regulator PhoP